MQRRKFGEITTVAGSGSDGLFGDGFSGDDEQATSARLNEPYGVAVDDVDRLYIADRKNHRIRRVELAVEMGGVAVPFSPASPAADHHGNDWKSATPLSLNSSLAVIIGTVDDEDWFRLEFDA